VEPNCVPLMMILTGSPLRKVPAEPATVATTFSGETPEAVTMAPLEPYGLLTTVMAGEVPAGAVQALPFGTLRPRLTPEV